MSIDWNEYLSTEYCYPIEIVSVYDGDTITCNIDLGFKIKLYKQKIRLFGINTPEVRGKSRPEGLISKQKLIDIMEGKSIKLYSIKDKKGKYGRWLGILSIDGDKEQNINKMLVDGGFAKLVNY